MSLLSFVLRDMMRPLRNLRMLENQMRMAEELFPSSVYQNRPSLTLDFDEDLLKRDAVIQDKEKYQLKLNVQGFKHQEISINTLNGNAIQIEVKREEMHHDKGFILRQLVRKRKFVLPKGHDVSSVVSTLSDGVLTITAPRKVEAIEEKSIPVTHEGKEEK